MSRDERYYSVPSMYSETALNNKYCFLKFSLIISTLLSWPAVLNAQTTHTVSVQLESSASVQEGNEFEAAAAQHIYFEITVTGPALSGNLELPYTLSGDIEFFRRNNLEETLDAHRDVFVPSANVPARIDNNGFYATRERLTAGGRTFSGEVLPNGTVTITPAQHGAGSSSTHYLIMMASDNFGTTNFSTGLNEANETLTLTLGTPTARGAGDTVSLGTSSSASVIIEDDDTCYLSWTMTSFGLNARNKVLVSEGATSAGGITLTKADRLRLSGGFHTGGPGTCISEGRVSISLEVYSDSADVQRPRRLTMINQESQNHNPSEPANSLANPDFRLTLPLGRDVPDILNDFVYIHPRTGAETDQSSQFNDKPIITIPAGQSSASIAIDIVEDGLGEGEEFLILQARVPGPVSVPVLVGSGGSGRPALGPGAGRVEFSTAYKEDLNDPCRCIGGGYIFIRQSSPGVRYTVSGPTSVAEGNVPTAYTVTINRLGATAQTVTWSVSGAGSSPAKSADFTCDRLPSGSVVFPANAAASSTLTFTLPEVVVDAVAGEGMERFQVSLSGGDAGGIRAIFGAPYETAITDEPMLPLPDINRDGTVNGRDTLIMYYAYTLGRELGDGQLSSGDSGLRSRLLGGLVASSISNPTDANYRDLMCNAISWRQIARPVGGDITGGVIDGNDALVMYYAYEFSDVVGTGAPGTGYLQLRTLLLNGLVAPLSPADADYRALIRQANRLKRR